MCVCVSTQVWSIRCDLHIVDHGGNLVDVASIAAVGALLHFRRPDVSVAGEKVTIHPIADRVPVPLSVHHVPICVSFAIFTDVSECVPVKQTLSATDASNQTFAGVSYPGCHCG